MASLADTGFCGVTCEAPPDCVGSLVPVCVRNRLLHPSLCPIRAWRRTVCTEQVATYSLETDVDGDASGVALSGVYSDWVQVSLTECTCTGGATTDSGGGTSRPASTQAVYATVLTTAAQARDATIPGGSKTWNLIARTTAGSGSCTIGIYGAMSDTDPGTLVCTLSVPVTGTTALADSCADTSHFTHYWAQASTLTGTGARYDIKVGY